MSPTHTQIDALVLDCLRDGERHQQVDLAWAIRHCLAPAWSLDTCRRRVKESAGRLVEQGHPIASDRRGYSIASSAEDRAAGRRYLVRQVSSIAKRLRSFDATGADRLAQLALELGAE